MSQIVKMPVRDLAHGDVVIETGGRILFRLSDHVLTPWARRTGLVAVCDTSGNPMAVDGHVEVTGILLDEFEHITDAYGQIISVSKWQASVN